MIRSIFAALIVIAPLAAAAEPGHDGTAQSAVPDTPATAAFRDATARMHREMDIRFTNDVDVDFVRLMIPHHRSAVAIARVLLDNSEDPTTRRMAEDVVRMQEKEIGEMQDDLARKGVAAD